MSLPKMTEIPGKGIVNLGAFTMDLLGEGRELPKFCGLSPELPNGKIIQMPSFMASYLPNRAVI